jgi:hypothetical protein
MAIHLSLFDISSRLENKTKNNMILLFQFDHTIWFRSVICYLLNQPSKDKFHFTTSNNDVAPKERGKPSL